MTADLTHLPWERPLGATPEGPGRTTFRAWAPNAREVAVEVRGARSPLAEEGLGVWAATLDAGHGDDYRLVLDGTPWPDPCSRWQPEGLRGPSRVGDPGTFSWTDQGWGGVALEDLVL